METPSSQYTAERKMDIIKFLGIHELPSRVNDETTTCQKVKVVEVIRYVTSNSQTDVFRNITPFVIVNGTTRPEKGS